MKRGRKEGEREGGRRMRRGRKEGALDITNAKPSCSLYCSDKSWVEAWKRLTFDTQTHRSLDDVESFEPEVDVIVRVVSKHHETVDTVRGKRREGG